MDKAILASITNLAMQEMKELAEEFDARWVESALGTAC